ncbi:MAG: MYXO-CTERM sorting domain-containing protein [Phycisphaerales bacterium]
MTVRARLLAGAAVASMATNVAMGCITDPPPPDPPTNPVWPTWYTVKSESPLGEGWVRQSLYLPIGLYFAPAQSCACGFGYSGAVLPTLTNGSVRIVSYTPNLSGGYPSIGDPVAPFDTLAPNDVTTSFLNSSTPFAGYNWFGFSGIVQNSEFISGYFAVCFQFDLTAEEDLLLKTRFGCVAGGSASLDGIPLLNDPIHPFGIVNCAPIPAPGAIGLLGLAGLASRRRR